jgi:hypothetical protein
MQIAINAVIFVIAFAVITQPIEIRKAINRFIKKLRLVKNGFIIKTPTSEWEEAALLSDDVAKIRPSSHLELLTRFVTSSSVILTRLTYY